MALDLTKILPKSLQNDFWVHFTEAITEELVAYKQERVDPKEHLQDVDKLAEQANTEQLLEIARNFGYSPDLSLRDSDEFPDFLRREIYSVPFRIRNKTLPVAYQYIFNTVPKTGTVAVMYWTGSALIRSIADITIEDHPATDPFIFPGQTQASNLVIQPLTLDFNPTLYLDGEEFPWSLDQEQNTIPTSHISLEYVADELILVGEDSVPYLITQEYMDYLLNAVHRNRKVTDVPHPTLQVTSIMDTSTFYDSANNGARYSIPDIQLRASVLSGFDYDNTIFSRMLFGIGNQELRSSSGSGSHPTSLANRVYSRDLELEQISSITSGGKAWQYVTGLAPGNSVNEETVVTSDGSTISVSGSLANVPITPGTVRITYTSFPNDYTITDNGEGTLSGDAATGTINYSTGAYSIDFQRNTRINETVHEGVSPVTGDEQAGVTEVTGFFLAQTPVVPSSFEITFTTGGGNNLFTTEDNGDGTIGDSGEVDGIADSPESILDYNTGELDVYFSQKTDDGKDINVAYQFSNTAIPDQGSEVQAAYWSDADLDITEVGLLDNDDNLVAYMTFPPVNLGSPNYYVAAQFLIRRDTF